MAKKSLKKLALSTETIGTLSAATLDNVQGGTLPIVIGTVVAFTLLFCAPQQAR